jgi:hypothetical protein
MTLLTSALPDTLTFNHTLSCKISSSVLHSPPNATPVNFTDPNSNGTHAACGFSWITAANGTNTAPKSYILCNRTADKGFFEWQFTTITNLTNFGVRFAHGFSDPV